MVAKKKTGKKTATKKTKRSKSSKKKFDESNINPKFLKIKSISKKEIRKFFDTKAPIPTSLGVSDILERFDTAHIIWEYPDSWQLAVGPFGWSYVTTESTTLLIYTHVHTIRYYLFEGSLITRYARDPFHGPYWKINGYGSKTYLTI